VLRRKEDRRVERVLVVDCAGPEPRVMHELDLQWSHDSDAAWHATRPIFAMVDSDKKFCVVNLEGDAPVITKTSIWNLIKFKHSSSHGHVYMAWAPDGRDIVAASCSDELLVTRIHNNEAVRVAVGPIADVNGRGFSWSRDGHLEVVFSDGDVTRYKPDRSELV
jgi:hypothetical protein